MDIAMISEHASPLAVLGGADAGGQNVHVAALSMALAERGHNVTVYTRQDGEEPTRVRFSDGVDVVHMKAGPQTPLAKDDLLPHLGEFADGLVQIWSRNAPDVIHSHFWMSGLIALDARLRSGITTPVAQTFHALGHVKRLYQQEADTSPLHRVALERDIVHRADAVIATCSDEVRELRTLGSLGNKTFIAPCGVDTTHFTPLGERSPQRGPRFLSIGRLVPRKGVEIAIRALAQVAGAELIVAGGPERSQLEADPEVMRLKSIAQEVGVAERVEFVGRVEHDKMPALIRSADAVLALPWYEPFGIVPLEAMACGVPVIATSVGGMLDTVVDGKTGILIPPQDEHAAAVAMRAVLNRPDRFRDFGRAGVERVRARYTWEIVAELTEKVYESLVSRTPVATSRAVRRVVPRASQ